jgi:3-deoxy-D-manno-octulosonate 8-phosphate phosphatase (KDO 8-P phosphatase)
MTGGQNDHAPLSLADRCRAVELLVLDVDGVLTDGGIVYGAAVTGAAELIEWKQFHVRDGSGLKAWRLAGKHSAILSGRAARVVEARAAELGIDAIVQGTVDKATAFAALLEAQGCRPEQAAFVGDDAADVPVLLRCGLAVAVADACPEALRAAHYVTRRPGGHGAVREIIERILRCQGRWPGVRSQESGVRSQESADGNEPEAQARDSSDS